MTTRGNMDVLAKYRYILNFLYDKIRQKSGDCPQCDDVLYIRRELEKISRELNVSLYLDVNDSSKP